MNDYYSDPPKYYYNLSSSRQHFTNQQTDNILRKNGSKQYTFPLLGAALEHLLICWPLSIYLFWFFVCFEFVCFSFEFCSNCIGTFYFFYTYTHTHLNYIVSEILKTHINFKIDIWYVDLKEQFFMYTQNFKIDICI